MFLRALMWRVLTAVCAWMSVCVEFRLLDEWCHVFLCRDVFDVCVLFLCTCVSVSMCTGCFVRIDALGLRKRPILRNGGPI